MSARSELSTKMFNTHRIILIFLVFLFVLKTNGQVPCAKGNTLFVMLKQPSLAFNTEPDIDVNVLQKIGFGMEFLYCGKMGLGVNVSRHNSDILFLDTQSFKKRKGYSFCPSFKLYLDSYSKLYVNLGTNIGFYSESQGNEAATNNQEYWQTAVVFGAGYKMYLFKRRRLGVDLFVGSNLVLWGNSETWTDALLNRGMVTQMSFFYKFQ